MTALTPSTVEALRELQDTVGEANDAKGFHDDAPDRNDFVPGDRGDIAYANALNHYHGNLFMLIVSEAAEGHDEIRGGKPADLTYYPTAQRDLDGTPVGGPHKPEGVPSETADIVIRAFDYAYRSGFDLAGIIVEKLAYNTTRPFKHGKKF